LPPCGIGEVGILCLAPPDILSGWRIYRVALGDLLGRACWRGGLRLVGMVEEVVGELVRCP